MPVEDSGSDGVALGLQILAARLGDRLYALWRVQFTASTLANLYVVLGVPSESTHQIVELYS